jgi:hypothetical protein
MKPSALFTQALAEARQLKIPCAVRDIEMKAFEIRMEQRGRTSLENQIEHDKQLILARQMKTPLDKVSEEIATAIDFAIAQVEQKKIPDTLSAIADASEQKLRLMRMSNIGKGTPTLARVEVDKVLNGDKAGIAKMMDPAHGPKTHPAEWTGGSYIGKDEYTKALEIAGAFEPRSRKIGISNEEREHLTFDHANAPASRSTPNFYDKNGKFDMSAILNSPEAKARLSQIGDRSAASTRDAVQANVNDSARISRAVVDAPTHPPVGIKPPGG